MHKVLLIGNPNVGKSTLFNSLTKSNERTGNFHGVTVNKKNKKIKFNSNEFDVFDLPGIYSLNIFTDEESVTKNAIFKKDSINLMLVDCNTLRKNLYLCLQLNELGINYKILINNYNFFIKNKNNLNIKKLREFLRCDIEIINAKKPKNIEKILEINKKEIKNINYLKNIIENIEKNIKIDKNKIINAINGDYNELTENQIIYIKKQLPDIVEARYKYIDEILRECITINNNFVYGYSKLDKFLLNPIFTLFFSILLFFSSIFLIFFIIGPFFSEILINLINNLIIFPLNNILILITDNIWVLDFFSSGVCGSLLAIISFLPQISLMFVFLTILEDSGLISRFAYVLDDLLSSIGLNGKCVYIILLGLGCNTASTMAIKSLNGKNLKTKSAIINPYISCMARLPIYAIITSAFFGKFAYLVIVGIYCLGLLLALILSLILQRKFLPTSGGELLLEFAPLKFIDLVHCLKVCFVNAKEFIKRIFGLVLSVGIIIWILTHTQFNFAYTQNINKSILFKIASLFSFIFTPIGLNNAGIVSALLVGFMAKELIISSISVANNVTTNLELISSLSLTTSVINFSLPTAVSFLIFSSIYCSCVSNLAVLKKETDTITMWLSIVSQFTIAYMLSYVAYQTLTKGFYNMLISVLIIFVIMMTCMIIIKKVKQQKCLTCGMCKRM